jgi:hypothetical protein
MTLTLLFLLFTACSLPSEEAVHFGPEGNTIETRFDPPKGFERIIASEHSFGAFLRQLPLKGSGAEVKLYNGDTKTRTDGYVAVVDLPIGKKDLHQCADAVIRLRAEYLWKEKQYDQIHFNFTNGFRADYIEWMKGKRIVVKGNKVSWVQKAQPSNTATDLWNYLETVFTYAGTLSLSGELKTRKASDMAIGDVFIQGGSPGHAVIVVDMAFNRETGKRVFMLAQSYMPAQEIQVLANPNDEARSPWYPLDFQEVLETPEWTFSSSNLKAF